MDTGRKGDENPNSSVVEDTLKLLAISSNVLPDHGPHSPQFNKVSQRQETQASINSKLFQKLDHLNNYLYEVELAKAQIEHKEPILVWFLILQYAKLPMVELYYNFFTKFCDVYKFGDFEKDTGLLYVALAEKEVEDCIGPDMITEWQRLWLKDCSEGFTVDVFGFSFLQICCDKHKKCDKQKPGFFNEEFRRTEMFCLRSKTYCCVDVASNKFLFKSKGLNKRELKKSSDGYLNKYRLVLHEKINITSTNRGFRRNNDTVAKHEQVKKGLSCFYSKINVESDGIHTQPLNL